MADDTFVVLRVLHLAHNNLSSQGKDATRTLGANPLAVLIEREQGSSLHAVGGAVAERPLYRNRIDAIRSSVPYRSFDADGHGLVLRPKPTVQAQQTAIVVGPPGAVIHTDRDHRIKVQFHRQRGEQSHSRLMHPVPDGHIGAPADDSTGTWVRIATQLAPVAGANWGAVAVRRQRSADRLHRRRHRRRSAILRSLLPVARRYVRLFRQSQRLTHCNNRYIMIAKFRTNVCSALVFMGLCSSASGYCADKNNCFTSVEQYAVQKFGGDFVDDENIVISVRDFGKTTFHVVEDKTSGTNHLRILLQYRSHEGFCAVLETPPVAELRVLNVDAAGFPVKLMAIDQAPPGLPENEITYVFNPLDAVYQMSRYRKIDRGARKVRARTVDCNKVFE